MSFFLGSWGMNRSAGQTNHVNRRFSDDLFVPRSDSFPKNLEKKDTHSLYLQIANKDSSKNSLINVINTKFSQ